MKKDPTRLSQGADELAASIAAFRKQGPGGERLGELAARLARAGAPIDAPAPASSAAPPSPHRMLELARPQRSFDSGVLAVVGALLGGGALIAGAVALRTSDVPSPLPASSASVQAPAAPSPSPPSVTDATPATGSHSALAAPRVSAVATTTASTAPPEAPAASGPNLDAPPRAPASVPATAKEPAPLEPSAASTTTPARRLDSARSVTPNVAAPSAPDPAKPTGEEHVSSEVELLKNARSTLAADPLQAFALTEQCRARYPSGAFAQEREYIAIMALVRLGRTNDARSRLSSFRTRYKNSAYLPRLTAVLGDE